MNRLAPLAAVMIVALAGSTAAQAPEALASMMPGMHWQSSSGVLVGTCFSNFSCQGINVPLTAGETATLTVTGDFMTPYVLAASTGANRCLSVPGISNSLALDEDLVILSTGLLESPNFIGPCGQSGVEFTTVIPANVPPGTQIAIQAVSVGIDLNNFLQVVPQFSTPFILTF